MSVLLVALLELLKCVVTVLNRVECQLSEIGKWCLDNQKVNKINHPYIYIQSFNQLL